MIIGDVFIWNDFPYPKYGPPKPRWFIFLGDSCILNGNVGYAYLISPTKQVDKYIEKYKDEKDYSYLVFNKNEYGFLKKCLIDNETGFYDDIYNDVIINNKEIKITDNIENSKLEIIYNNILKSHKDINPKVLKNIKKCFESYCGIVL